MAVFSDNPPALIVPDTPEGGDWIRREKADCVYRCSNYRREWGRIITRHDMQLHFWPCDNRDHSGDWSYNWCMRCLAGWPAMRLKQDDPGDSNRFAVSV